MASMPAETTGIVGGVDTHQDLHTAAIVTLEGAWCSAPNRSPRHGPATGRCLPGSGLTASCCAWESNPPAATALALPGTWRCPECPSSDSPVTTMRQRTCQDRRRVKGGCASNPNHPAPRRSRVRPARWNCSPRARMAPKLARWHPRMAVVPAILPPAHLILFSRGPWSRFRTSGVTCRASSASYSSIREDAAGVHAVVNPRSIRRSPCPAPRCPSPRASCSHVPRSLPGREAADTPADPHPATRFI